MQTLTQNLPPLDNLLSKLDEEHNQKVQQIKDAYATLASVGAVPASATIGSMLPSLAPQPYKPFNGITFSGEDSAETTAMNMAKNISRGRELGILIEFLGLSRKEFADFYGVSYQAVNQKISNDRKFRMDSRNKTIAAVQSWIDSRNAS